MRVEDFTAKEVSPSVLSFSSERNAMPSYARLKT